MDASHVYVGALALGCFYSQYPNLSEGADRVAGQLRGDKECPFSRVTKSGRVWRKVPESDARSVERISVDGASKVSSLAKPVSLLLGVAERPVTEPLQQTRHVEPERLVSSWS